MEELNKANESYHVFLLMNTEAAGAKGNCTIVSAVRKYFRILKLCTHCVHN